MGTPKTLAEVMRDVIARPMNVAEIVVAVKEAEYVTSMNPLNFRNTVKEVLNSAVISRSGERWKAPRGSRREKGVLK